MKTREQYEDIIQKGICMILPKMPPQDIRPAYQQQDNAGKVMQTDDSTYEYLPFTPADNFIYIRVKISDTPIGPYVSATGVVEITNTINATITIYGSQSSQLAKCVYALLATDSIVQFFSSEGLFYQSISDRIDELREIINEQWYERHEFTISFGETTAIRSPENIKPVKADDADIRKFTYENDTKIGEDIIDL